MDAIVIRFTTAAFDVTKERPNDINQIYGESLLLWLAEKSKGRIDVPRPQTEDWGWYVDIDWNGRSYLLGSSASDEDESGAREWVLQIVKHRTMKERLLGKEKMAIEDECAAYLGELLKREPSFSGVSVD
jgi:hypothetical protein